MAVERIHSKRSFAGVYKKDLEDIESQIEVIEKREGLDEFEYWLIGEGPEDWNQLNNQYDLILDVKFEETLREFGLEDMAELYLSPLIHLKLRFQHTLNDSDSLI